MGSICQKLQLACFVILYHIYTELALHSLS